MCQLGSVVVRVQEVQRPPLCFVILIFPDFLSLSLVAFLCARVGEGSFLIYLKKKTVHLTADIRSENVHSMHLHKTLSRKERLAAWKSAKGANGENSMAGTNGSGIAKKTRAKKRFAWRRRREGWPSPRLRQAFEKVPCYLRSKVSLLLLPNAQ